MDSLPTRFDSVVLGDSLAARVAAALLARGGRRLLVLHEEAGAAASPSWPWGSLLLDRLLDRLDGRSVLTRPPRLQILSGTIRLELNGRTPLAEELRRELGAKAAPAAEILQDLEDFGGRLADLLWEGGGLPLAGTAARLRFSARALQRGLPARRLEQPLEGRLADLEPAVAGLLCDLLPALCQLPARHLTLAEAALAWHGVRHPEGVSAAGLDELLGHRYRQFHGREEALSGLATVEAGGRSGVLLRFADGRTVSAGSLIFARNELARRFFPGRAEAALPPPPRAIRLRVGDRVSPVIADRVLLGGAPPLRLSFSGTGSGRELVVEWPGEIAREELVPRLAALLPFAPLALDALPEPAIPPRTGGLAAAARAIRLGRQSFLCGPCPLPALGCVGEVLGGWSVANALLTGSGKDDG